MPVKVLNCGITHRAGHCYDCGKTWQNYKDKNMTTKIRSHIEKTGHQVGYEYMTARRYEKE